MTARRNCVLISHHKSDNTWRKRLVDYLRPLEDLQKTRVWDRTVVKAGEKPDEEYQRALEEAKVAIPLVSPAYLADKALSNELKYIDTLVSHDLTLLWIAVDYSAWQETVLRKHEYANNDPERPLKDHPRPGKEIRSIYLKIQEKLEQYSNNLPARHMIRGREQEVNDLCSLLRQDENRGVVLAGLAGVGKTIVALEVAHQLLRDFEHGVLWVDLRGLLNEHSLIRGEIAQQLDRIKPHIVTEEILIDYIGDRKILMVLDNFESVPDATDFVIDLLKQAPQLKVLITSRNPLLSLVSDQQGYEQYELPPLDQNDSVQLMLDFTRENLDHVQLDEQQIEILTTIAKGLVGNPLAIRLRAAEVAARWTRERPNS